VAGAGLAESLKASREETAKLEGALAESQANSLLLEGDAKANADTLQQKLQEAQAACAKAEENAAREAQKGRDMADKIEIMERRSQQREDEFAKNMVAMGMKFKQYQDACRCSSDPDASA